MVNLVREHIPLEQGLRRLLQCALLHWTMVREHIPLEQGLRQFLETRHFINGLKVREHIPLEQGLRQDTFLTVNMPFST